MVILIILGLGAFAAVALALLMLMDHSKKREGDDFGSRVSQAVDRTARANGLWTRRMRLQAAAFLVLVVLAVLTAVLVLQRYSHSTWNF
ncbi:MAG: hypothetical protein EA401_10020 [Planctomycetota bacterium]|nr:MAG: hypothetical protein EA401_10020 [Planctomycetota bacterium]